MRTEIERCKCSVDKEEQENDDSIGSGGDRRVNPRLRPPSSGMHE